MAPKIVPHKKKFIPKVIKLKELQALDFFCFMDSNFDPNKIIEDDGALVYMVVIATKDQVVKVIDMTKGVLLSKDDDREVVQIVMTLHAHEIQQVPAE